MGMMIFIVISTLITACLVEALCLAIKSLSERVFHPVYSVCALVAIIPLLFVSFLLAYMSTSESIREWRHYSSLTKEEQKDEDNRRNTERPMSENEWKHKYHYSGY